MSWFKSLLNKARGVFGTPRAAEDGCHHDAIHLRQGTAEFEWFVARGELEMQGDLQHGARHLANLLSYDPGRAEWVELLERYLAAAAPDAESLIPREENLYYSTEAMRAYIWHQQGRLEEAVALLVNVVEAKPDARYMDTWGLDWLEPPGAMESLSPGTGVRVLSSALMRSSEARYLPLPRLREVVRWARLAQRFAPQLPEEAMSVMLRAGLLRKAGLFDEALAVVRPAMERSPDWHVATALGLIYRQQDQCERAEQAFREALRFDPSDVSARLEAGDTFFEREQWEPALRWYEEALGVEARQAWAAPSALFCRWKLTGDQRYLDEMVKLAKARAGNDRARNLCYQAYSDQLPEPVDATANVLRQIREKIQEDPESFPSGGEIKLTLSGLEAPSNFLAFRMEMEALGVDLQLPVVVERIAKPDPRWPVVEGKYLLWTYDGTEPSPAMSPPPADVSARIAELAAARYHPHENWAAASRVAEELGPARVGEVLATMVHPPRMPAGCNALTWLPRVQHAAAQVAAQVDQGWDDSARREALLAVLLGPTDWTTQAAIAVLARLGRENEAFAPDIHDAFQQLADHRPDQGFCCWERDLYAHWLELPHLFDNERQEIQKVLKEIDARDA